MNDRAPEDFGPDSTPDWWTKIGEVITHERGLPLDQRSIENQASLVVLSLGPASCAPNLHTPIQGEVSLAFQLYDAQTLADMDPESDRYPPPDEEVVIHFDEAKWREMFHLGMAIIQESSSEAEL